MNRLLATHRRIAERIAEAAFASAATAEILADPLYDPVLSHVELQEIRTILGNTETGKETSRRRKDSRHEAPVLPAVGSGGRTTRRPRKHRQRPGDANLFTPRPDNA